uniref:Uncharacterized protein n=1 Tax=Lepisosteus oculatus TaxID=7918 RepID=W5LVU4_LEPOC
MGVSRHFLGVLVGILVGVVLSYCYFKIFFESQSPGRYTPDYFKIYFESQSPGRYTPERHCDAIPKIITSPEGLVYKQTRVLEPRRRDVLTVTPWLAPIVWEGTFDPLIIDSIYKPLNVTIATTVFAVGK